MDKKKSRLVRIILLIILSVSIMFMASVYAMLREKVSVVGKANLAEQANQVQDYTVTYVVSNKWYSTNKFYSIIDMTLTNNTDTVANGWKIQITIPENSKIISYSNTNCTVKSSTVLFENLSYNSQVQGKSSVSFQFQISASNKYYEPQNIIINDNIVVPPDNSGGDIIKQAQVSFTQDNSWQSGKYKYFQYTAIVQNIGNAEIYSWQFELSEKSITIDQIWNAIITVNSIIANSEYNGIIQPNGQVSFGFIVKTSKQNITLQAINIVVQ